MSLRAFVKVPYSFVCAVWLPLSMGCIELGLVGSTLDEPEREPEEPYCSYTQPEAEPPSAPFAGSASSRRPGQLGRGRLDVALDEDTVAHLEAVEVTMTVKTGQALPGQTLELTFDDRLLQTAPVTGPLGNEAHFLVSVKPDQCAAPCVLQFLVSGPSLDLAVPVPIELEGIVRIQFQKTPDYCPVPPLAAAYDADKETSDAR